MPYTFTMVEEVVDGGGMESFGVGRVPSVFVRCLARAADARARFALVCCCCLSAFFSSLFVLFLLENIMMVLRVRFTSLSGWRW